MTLLITVFAAVISTAIWYKQSDNTMCLAPLCFMFWGASIMWFGDAIFEYAKLRTAYFTPSAADMRNDTFLGLSVVALALVIWTIILLIKDPKGTVRKALMKKANK